jgi:molecular chaperone GrpE
MSEEQVMQETPSTPDQAANGAPAQEGVAPQVDLEAVRRELAEAQAKMAEYLDGWQRARADFMNYKKRVERDQALTQQEAAARVIKRFLEVSDDLERALKNRPTDGEGAAWAGGVEMIQRKLINVIDQEGVKVMDMGDLTFDPTRHEAVMSEENPDYASGKIIEVLQTGYVIGERVLRPALVKVAR